MRPKPTLENTSTVFRLQTGYWDFDKGDEDKPFRTPELGVYGSAADAAADNEGLSIVETLAGYDDLWFFAVDGSPLEAQFSQQPYINFEKNTYFRGVYSLHPGSGTNLVDAMAEIIASNQERSPQARIAVWVASTDEAAKEFGWSTSEAMKEGVVLALRILPPGLQKRFIFAKLPYSGGFSLSIEEAVRSD